jgi:hypothetical protein
MFVRDFAATDLAHRLLLNSFVGNLDLATRISAGLRASTGPWLHLHAHLSHADQVTLEKLCGWICTFDQVIGELSREHAELHVARYERLVLLRGCPELACDPLARRFREVLAMLATAPLGEALWPLFATQVIASCRATLAFERADADRTCLGFVLTAAAMLVGETEAPRHVAALLTAQRCAAAAVRTRLQSERRMLDRALDRMAALPDTADVVRRLTDALLDVDGELGDGVAVPLAV